MTEAESFQIQVQALQDWIDGLPTNAKYRGNDITIRKTGVDSTMEITDAGQRKFRSFEIVMADPGFDVPAGDYIEIENRRGVFVGAIFGQPKETTGGYAIRVEQAP